MNLIVETDLGHDPDDFFALCYLIAAGVRVKCVNVTPGFDFQVALADLIRRETGVHFDIGVAEGGRGCGTVGGVHASILGAYGATGGVADGLGDDLTDRAISGSPDAEVLVIGPPKSTGRFFQRFPTRPVNRVVIQGGFLGYHAYRPAHPLPQFDGKTSVPSFNPNGDPKGVAAIQTGNVGERYWVSKNVCHGVVFDRERWHDMTGRSSTPCSARAAGMFAYAAEAYLAKHGSKKFHDPTAAVCLLHPEIATWVRADMTRVKGGWEGVPNPWGDFVIGDINRESLWDHLANFT